MSAGLLSEVHASCSPWISLSQVLSGPEGSQLMRLTGFHVQMSSAPYQGELISIQLSFCHDASSSFITSVSGNYFCINNSIIFYFISLTLSLSSTFDLSPCHFSSPSLPLFPVFLVVSSIPFLSVISNLLLWIVHFHHFLSNHLISFPSWSLCLLFYHSVSVTLIKSCCFSS